MRNKKSIKARMKSALKAIPACFMIVALGLPAPCSASMRKTGQILHITMKDRRTIEGELLAVKGDRLVIMDSSSLAGIEVQIGDALHLQVRKKSKFLKGLGIGLLNGAAAGALLGFLSGDDEEGLFAMTAEQKAIGGALVFGILGAPIGGIAGAITGIDESIDLASMNPGQKDRVLEKLKSYARTGYNLPQNVKIFPLTPAEEETKAAPKEKIPAISKEPEKKASPPTESKKISRFHLGLSPGYFLSAGLGQLKDLLNDSGFSGAESYSGWFGSGTIEYPQVVKNPVLNVLDLSVEYSFSKNFALGLAYSPLGKHGVDGRHVIPNKDYRSSLPDGYVPETFLTGFCGGRAVFLTASYFPIPDAFLKKFTIKLTAGIGLGRSNMDFFGCEYEYNYDSSGPYSQLDQKSFSKNVPAIRFGAEWIYFFNAHWTLGLSGHYQYVPLKINGFTIDCAYWYYDAAPPAGQMIYDALHVDIPGRTWNLGGLGLGLNFGYHF